MSTTPAPQHDLATARAMRRAAALLLAISLCITLAGAAASAHTLTVVGVALTATTSGALMLLASDGRSFRARRFEQDDLGEGPR